MDREILATLNMVPVGVLLGQVLAAQIISIKSISI